MACLDHSHQRCRRSRGSVGYFGKGCCIDPSLLVLWYPPISAVIFRRRSIASVERKPCLNMALPSPRGAPGEAPPCIQHLPFGICAEAPTAAPGACGTPRTGRRQGQVLHPGRRAWVAAQFSACPSTFACFVWHFFPRSFTRWLVGRRRIGPVIRALEPPCWPLAGLTGAGAPLQVPRKRAGSVASLSATTVDRVSRWSRLGGAEAAPKPRAGSTRRTRCSTRSATCWSP